MTFVLCGFLCISCVGESGNNNSSREYTKPETVASIRMPELFNPRTPLNNKIRNTTLRQLVIEKYYSFKNPRNRRKHNMDCVGVEETNHLPMSYDEMQTLLAEHSLSACFFDAAYRDKWNTFSNSIYKEDIISVSEKSNLAKVYFIDDFASFVRHNSKYCEDIIKAIEDSVADMLRNEILAKQRMYE